MASWTDSVPQFNPYIPQLPVEAMVQVGMEKQRRYDEGLQKIQSYIDNIAGLDIIREVDRNYLQTKLNDLGSRLTTVAAGDFSNFQLVNSVSGMANQVVKDKNIQTAVSSTAWYRKQMAEMEKAISDGKSSPSNEWLFNKMANEYLSSTDLPRSFNDRYKPFVNYKKNALEVIKSLTKDSSITDDAFTVDSKGNLVIADAIVRKKLAGISPDKIQQALLVGLTPGDFEQMETDGRYNYSNVSDDAFKLYVNNSYSEKRNGFLEQRKVLENAKSTTPSATEKASLDAKIAEIDKVLNKIDQEHESISSSFDSGSTESAKARLFTSNFINGFSRAFSFTETSQTYENSPLAQMAMEREKLNRDWKKFTLEFEQSERHFAASQAMEREKLAISQEANRIAKMAAEGYGAFPSPVDPKDVPEVSLGKVVNQAEELRTTVQTLDTQIVEQYGKDQPWLNAQYHAWLKSPKGIDPVLAAHFNRTHPMIREAMQNEMMVAQINNEADKQFPGLYDAIPKNAPNVKHTTSDGTVYTFTPKEFVDYNNIKQKYITNLRAFGGLTTGSGGAEVAYDLDGAKKAMSNKEFKLFTIEAEKSRRGKSNLSKGNLTLIDWINDYDKKINKPYKPILEQKLDWIGKEVNRRVTAFQGMEYTIPTDNTAKKESFSNILTAASQMAKSQTGGIANSPNLNLDVLTKLAESGDARGKIKVVEGSQFAPTMYEVTASGKDGTTSFRITAEQKNAMFGDRFEASPAVQAFRPYQNMMRKFSNDDSPFWSTSPIKGETNVGNAELGPTDFPSVGAYGVSGNIISPDGGQTYSLRLNLRDPITGKVIENVPYPRMLREDEVAPAMLGINDAWIFEVLNGKNATTRDLQLLQKASKKPL